MSQHQTPPRHPVAKFVFFALIGLGIVCAAIYLSQLGQRDRTGTGGGRPETGAVPLPASDAAESGTTTLATQEVALAAKPAFRPLVGRWLREDGGYIIEIAEVLPDGTLKAGYFNPRPIRVSKAAAVEDSGSVKVGIELNDVNYPGCLYTLLYNTQLDQLQGTYFQAAQGQTYEIAFVRMPEE